MTTITVPRETWDAMREALKDISEESYDKGAVECANHALTAAASVSHPKTETAPPAEGGAITSESAANAVSAEPQAKGEAIPHSGADENPPVFGRRWKIAADGFGLQRDDLNGRYVDIDNALSVLHAAHPQATEPAWRPIETAPKDTQILAAAEFYGAGDWRIKSGYLDDSGWHIWGASWTPTHWQPLPAAPEAKQ